MAQTPTPFELALIDAPDASIRAGLWLWTPEQRPAVIHERRVRFPGEFETEEIDPDYH